MVSPWLAGAIKIETAHVLSAPKPAQSPKINLAVGGCACDGHRRVFLLDAAASGPRFHSTRHSPRYACGDRLLARSSARSGGSSTPPDQTPATSRAGTQANTGTSGLYTAGGDASSTTGPAPDGHRGGTLPDCASAGVRYAGLDDRLRLLG